MLDALPVQLGELVAVGVRHVLVEHGEQQRTEGGERRVVPEDGGVGLVARARQPAHERV